MGRDNQGAGQVPDPALPGSHAAVRRNDTPLSKVVREVVPLGTGTGVGRVPGVEATLSRAAA